MSRTLRTLALCAVLVGTAGGAGRAQERQVFRSAIDAVRVDVLATDGGRPIGGLSAADFEVRDNGVLQAVDLATQSGGAHVVQVLDASGSVHGPTLDQLKDAARMVVGLLGPDDRMSLVTFAERIVLHAQASRDPAAIMVSIDQLSEGGWTALRDAVYAGLSMATLDQGRSMLLVYSDGLENASWLSEWNIVDAAKRSEVVIYGVGVAPVGRRAFGATPADRGGLLAQLAERSGGDYLLTSSQKPLAAVFAGVLTEFRSRYLLTYTPQGVKRDDGWHRLSVKLKNRPGRVTARAGYMASAPASRQ